MFLGLHFVFWRRGGERVKGLGFADFVVCFFVVRCVVEGRSLGVFAFVWGLGWKESSLWWRTGEHFQGED